MAKGRDNRNKNNRLTSKNGKPVLKRYNTEDNKKPKIEKEHKLSFVRSPESAKRYLDKEITEAEAKMKANPNEKDDIAFRLNLKVEGMRNFGLKDGDDAWSKVAKYGRQNTLVKIIQSDGTILKDRAIVYNGLAIIDGVMYKVDKKGFILKDDFVFYG